MDDRLSIVLLGKVGVGKSASANTILGREAFESRTSFGRVTKHVSMETGTVFGKSVTVIDTPDISGSEEQIKNFCQYFLQESIPTLFLLVFKIDRFTDDDQETVEATKRVIGPQRMKNCFLLFSGGDTITSLSNYISDYKSSLLPEVVKSFSSRIHLFNNKDEGRRQVRELLLKSGHITTGKV